MSDEECCSSYTAPSRVHSISPHCVGRVLNETMLSLAHALFSPGSAEDRSSLFVWFIDTMARSDSSRTCVSALWLWAFADRPRSLSGRGAPEVSRFSCMLFLSVRGFFDYAGPTARSRLSRNSRIAFLQSGESRRPGFAFFEAQ